IQLHPADEGAWTRFDALIAGCEDYPETIEFCRAIAKLHPNNLPALHRLSRAFKKQGRHGDLLTISLQLIKLKSDDAQAWSNLADTFAATNKYTEAISAYEKALEL